MIRNLAITSLLCAALTQAPAQAQSLERIGLTPIIVDVAPTAWKCKRWNGTNCSLADLGNPYYRQILVLPTGFTESERSQFWVHFDKVYTQMSSQTATATWSGQKRDQLLYVGYFVAGGRLGAADAAFGGAIVGYSSYSLIEQQVYDRVAQIQVKEIPSLRPIGTAVLYNTWGDGISTDDGFASTSLVS